MKHNDIISELEKRCKENHPDSIHLREWDYNLKCRKHGEADYLMIDIFRDYAYAFEVKTYDSKKHRGKAYNQCDKDRKYIKEQYNIDRVFKFYAYSKDNNYKVERVK
ncbi:MAG: hypothetical protein ACQESN_08695 [Thermotogota bacterium]